MERSLIKTSRLILRPWREEDLEPYAQLNADPRVMEFFPSPISYEDSLKEFNRFKQIIEENGWGVWAASLKDSGQFIGFIGLNQVGFSAPFTPAVEVGWRLAYDHWNKGYATEGAKVALKYGFEMLKLEEIISFTAVQNLKSQNVMRKIGMAHNPQDNFDHPRLPVDHWLKHHVLYRIKKDALITFISETPPDKFSPKCQVAACYLEIDGNILLMERSQKESEARTWGVPAGKIEFSESPLKGALRELYEETGIQASSDQLHKLGQIYIQKPTGSYIYHMFQVTLKEKPQITLSDEHTQYAWADKQMVEQLPLIGGAYEALSHYKRNKKRYKL